MLLLRLLKQHKDNLAIIEKNEVYNRFKNSIRALCLTLFAIPYIVIFIYQFSNYDVWLALTVYIVQSFIIRLIYVILIYGLVQVINEKEHKQ